MGEDLTTVVIPGILDFVRDCSFKKPATIEHDSIITKQAVLCTRESYCPNTDGIEFGGQRVKICKPYNHKP